MSNKLYQCSEDCDSRDHEFAEENEKPCNCWNNDLALLRARIKELEQKLRIPDETRTCAEITCDECNDRCQAQVIRIKELEQRLKQYKNLRQILRKRILDYQTASIDCSNNRLDRSRYEGIATGTRWAAEDMEEADRIEKVMARK